jgi:6-pyruvoyltetrahydropterin/6-carboxytetrahydropterin synthase
MPRSVTLSRKVSFSSGHRYWRDGLTPDENVGLFGTWASPFNHGHNYVLWVTARGAVDLTNGMVVNIKWIDDVLQERVVAVFDQKSINDEVAAFNAVPSVENLLRHFASLLSDLPGGVELTDLKLEETPLFYGEWKKENDMVSLTRTYEFAAAHRLAVASLPEDENFRLFGKCHNPHGHGHNYVLEVTVTGDPDPVTGFLCDLEKLDRVVETEIVERYDHHNLDTDVDELSGKNTTSEVVVSAIFDRLKGKLPADLVRVRLFETARNVFEVTA